MIEFLSIFEFKFLVILDWRLWIRNQWFKNSQSGSGSTTLPIGLYVFVFDIIAQKKVFNFKDSIEVHFLEWLRFYRNALPPPPIWLLIRLWKFFKRHNTLETQLCLIRIGCLKLVGVFFDKMWNRTPNADFVLDAITICFSTNYNFVHNLLDEMIWMSPHLVRLSFQIMTWTRTYTVCPRSLVHFKNRHLQGYL